MLASSKYTHNAKRKFNYTLGYMLIETCRFCVCLFCSPARAQLKLVFVVASFEFSCTPDCHLSLSLSLSPRNFLRGKRGCAHTKEITAASGRENESETVSLRSICLHTMQCIVFTSDSPNRAGQFKYYYL